MDWKKYWDNNAANDDPFVQVERYIKNEPLDTKTISEISAYIINTLKIQLHETVLDICCGNGLLTKLLSQHCQHIYGFDFSGAQIENAKANNNAENITYEVADALLSSKQFVQKADKILLYFSFQYFDTFRKGKKVITEAAKLLNNGGMMLIGDIPAKEHLWKFYKTPKDKMRYLKNNVLNKNPMGKFWSKEELDKICDKLNLDGIYLQQSDHLPYSSYRFDYLIKMKNS
ncbi:MAG: hypothetical protein COA57_12655 [Flavobacteriales bacterium]|nr:MAG: hypothetical protein COA57_12655 [Flavobacteriales bacterium]